MQEDALVAINERDFRLASSSGHEARVIGEVALGKDIFHINDIWPHRTGGYGKVDRLVVDGQGDFFTRHGSLLIEPVNYMALASARPKAICELDSPAGPEREDGAKRFGEGALA